MRENCFMLGRNELEFLRKNQMITQMNCQVNMILWPWTSSARLRKKAKFSRSKWDQESVVTFTKLSLPKKSVRKSLKTNQKTCILRKSVRKWSRNSYLDQKVTFFLILEQIHLFCTKFKMINWLRSKVMQWKKCKSFRMIKHKSLLRLLLNHQKIRLAIMQRNLIRNDQA